MNGKIEGWKGKKSLRIKRMDSWREKRSRSGRMEGRKEGVRV